MVSRKRVRDEMEAEAPAKEPTTLNKLRNMWQFANLAQYLALFIEALRIDKDFDIEVRFRGTPGRIGCAGRNFDGTNANCDAGPGE
jgi:hypothetical protein